MRVAVICVLFILRVQCAFWDSSEEITQDGLVNTIVKATKVKNESSRPLDYTEVLLQLKVLLEWMLGVLSVIAICNVYSLLNELVAEKIKKATQRNRIG